MEWYFGSEVDDLLVPTDQTPLERMISSDSWSQWGISAFGSSEFPKKNFCAGTNLILEKLTFNGKNFCTAVDIDNSCQETEHSINSSMYEGLYNGSLQWTTVSHEQADYQFSEDQARNDDMDDIFFSSLLEEDLTSMDNLHGSSSCSPQSQYSMMPSDNISKDMILESEYIPSHAFVMGSSKYLKTHAFSPSVDWENGEVSSIAKEDNSNSYVGKEICSEELVLQELGRVTAQLTEKTRICFRDALYSLAENSKQTENLSQDGDIIMENHPIVTSDGETLRMGETEVTEWKTNAIDRAIANLIFSNINFDRQDTEAAAQLNYRLTQPPISCCPNLTNFASDAEVPIICQENSLPPKANILTDFSVRAVSAI